MENLAFVAMIFFAGILTATGLFFALILLAFWAVQHDEKRDRKLEEQRWNALGSEVASTDVE